MIKIDPTEKKIVIATILLMGVFVFSILYAKEKYQANVPECVPYNAAYLKPKVESLNPHLYRVFAVASMWQFEPSDIKIPAGSEVDIYLSSKDVVHGFNIASKNVNMMAVYGSINKTTVRFDKPGEYFITCHEYCGVGHQFMQGKITVTQNSLTKTK
jgi:cytochrome c oxidase subunit 2